jgi:PAS domain S-box-containing protein
MKRSASTTDLIIAIVAVVTVLLAGIYLDLFEYIDGYLHSFEQWQFDELLLALLSLSMAAFWFSYRRWKESHETTELALEAQQKLQEAQARHEEAQHVAQLGHWALDLINNHLIWSKENYHIFGVEVGNKNTYEFFLDRVHPDDRDYVNQSYSDSVENRTPYNIEHRLLMPDGSIKWVHERCQTYYDDDTALRSIGTVQDITKRKLAEVELVESRARFSGIVEMAADAIISINEEQIITLFNKAAEKMFGCTQLDVLGEHVEKLIPERFHGSHRKRVKEYGEDDDLALIYSGATMYGKRMNGEEFPVETSTSKQVIGDETIMTVMMRDLSDQMKAEILQRKLLKAIDQAGEAVVITDRNAIIEYVNPAFTDITGYEADEAIGNTPSMLKSYAQNPKFYEEMWQTIAAGNAWHGTLIDKRKDGSFYPALMNVSPIHDESGEITHYVSLQQDMTEFKRMEEQFLQAQKMEAVGTLVGGIAHDFNNILAGIQGNVYLANMKLDRGSEVKKKLSDIEKLSNQAADMVRQLLTFARKDNIKKHYLSFNSFMKEGFKLAKTAITEDVEITCDICREELIINGDGTQLQQVLMNLLNNARDAVANVSQPEINCTVTAFTAPATFMQEHPDLQNKEYARLTIRDNGSGMTTDQQAKIFEPFFTTKGVGKGTGLGLAMVYGAVQNHGGIIEVESKMGEGSAFHLYFPAKKEKRESVREEESATTRRGQGETILLVDDELSVIETISEVLTSFGYTVLTASDGEQAYQLFTSHRNDISLVITDVVMPKMGGVDLAKRIRQLDKNIAVVFATGYDMSNALDAGNEIEGSIVLRKPYSIRKLSHTIHHILKGK